MKKKFVKTLASFLAAIMTIGLLQPAFVLTANAEEVVTGGDAIVSGNEAIVPLDEVTDVVAYAASNEITYTADQLNADWGSCVYNLTDAGWELDFSGKNQYAQVKLRLPEAVNMADCEEVRFNVKNQVGAITLKLWSDSDSSNEKVADYGHEGSEEYIWKPNCTDTIDLIGIAECNNEKVVPDGCKVTVEGVTFVMKEEEPKSNEITYAASTLNADWGNCDYTKTEAGWELNFGGKNQYAEVKLRLPEEVDMTNCEAVKVKVKDQVGAITLKLWSDSKPSEAVAVKYGFGAGAEEHVWNDYNYADKIQLLGVAENNNASPVPDGCKVTVESVTFVMKEAEPVIKEYKYLASELNITDRYGSGDVKVTADGDLRKIEFLARYKDARIATPSEVDMEKCEKVIIEVEAGATVDWDYKIIVGNSGGEASKSSGGNTIVEFVPSGAGDVGIMSTTAPDGDGVYITPHSVVIKSVTYVVNESATEEPDAPVEAEYEFAADELKIINVKNGEGEVNVGKNDDGTYEQKYDWNFNKNWSEVVLELPEEINAKKCKQVIFTMKDVEGGNLSFKLYDGGSELTAWYSKPPATEYKFSPSIRGNINAIGIMAHERTPEITAADPVKATLVSVKFIMDTTPDKPIEIEKDIPDLYKEIQGKLGDDARMGTCLSPKHFDDEYLMELVKKHYNAITLENELKPETILKGMNAELVEDATYGITVPAKLRFEPAEGMLDKILEINKEEGHEDQFKVRGHVLLWYQQTPAWFFCEDYDANKPQVSKEVMDKRLHWYINSVLTHFLTNDKYKDLFYAWDVVNEAIMDSGADRTNDKAWADVYGDNSYIENAFIYAHEVAKDTSVELYYNDFNDEVASKARGIVDLVNGINKRNGQIVDAIGLQGHYTMASPDAKKFETALRIYAEAGLTVQLTELDMKVSKDFDGSAAMLETEYTKQAWRYKQLYDVMVKLKKEGVKFNGITFWGVRDCDSWLQEGNWVNGGSDGKQKHYPLLFDDDYTAKLAYWAFVDPDNHLDPFVQEVTFIEETDAFDVMDEAAKSKYTYSFGADTQAEFIPMWNEEGLKFEVIVMDTTTDVSDKVDFYIDSETTPKASVSRADAEEISGGYKVVVDVSYTAESHQKLTLDVKVTNDGKATFFNDLKATDNPNAKFMAKGVLKPYTIISGGTVKIGGTTPDAKWDLVEDKVLMPFKTGAPEATNAYAKLLWDKDYLYVLAEVEDPSIYTATGDAHEKDSVEVFVDEDNSKDAYGAADQQYRVNADNVQTFGAGSKKEESLTSYVRKTEKGYLVEMAIKWTDAPALNKEIGLEVQINDAKDATSKRIGTLSWFDESGTGWSGTSVFGTAMLGDELEIPADQAEVYVHHIYDDVEDAAKMTSEFYTVGEEIESIEVDEKYGYEFDKIDVALPYKVVSGGNNINVYYKVKMVTVSVNYFVDGTEKKNWSYDLTAAVGSTITDVKDKMPEGYKLDKANLPYVVVDDENAINIYYVEEVTDPDPEPEPEPETPDYKITAGANQTMQENADGTITITCNGDLAKFVRVEVDGKVVDSKFYTLKSGSTILTFTNEFLGTLSVGKHTVKFVYTDGETETGLTVKEVSTEPNPDPTDPPKTDNGDEDNNDDDDSDDTVVGKDNEPKTGDFGEMKNIMIPLAVAAVAGAGFVVATAVQKKKKEDE